MKKEYKTPQLVVEDVKTNYDLLLQQDSAQEVLSRKLGIEEDEEEEHVPSLW